MLTPSLCTQDPDAPVAEARQDNDGSSQQLFGEDGESEEEEGEKEDEAEEASESMDEFAIVARDDCELQVHAAGVVYPSLLRALSF